MDALQLKKLLKIIQKVFLIICLIFLFKFFINSWASLIDIIKQANWLYLFLSLVFWQFLVWLIPYFSYQIIRAQSHTLNYTSLFQIYVNRLPAKYIPGGIWQTVARFHDLNKLGVSKTELSILVFYENFWSALIAGVIGSVGIIFYHPNSYWETVAIIIILVSIFCLFLIFILRNLKIILTLKSYLVISFINICFWVCASISFYFYTYSLIIFTSDTSLIVNSVHYIFSWLIGFLSIFTPQGIGVFELTISQLSRLNYSLEETIIFLAGFRLIVFMSDILSWCALTLWTKYKYEK